MPTVAQIEQALFQLAPKDLAFDWDNVGHLEGSPDQEVQRVLVALDVTENVVSEAEKLGCQLIVHSMHAGTEYEREPTSQQKTVAAHAVDMGADLVVGHHAHVVQGYALLEGVPVAYSLGNAVFGGNRDPRDYDALLLQAVFRFEEGVPDGVRLVFHPISVSGETGYNNYQPVLLTGDDAQRVLEKMADSTGVTPPAFIEGQGAATEAFPVGGA